MKLLLSLMAAAVAVLLPSDAWAILPALPVLAAAAASAAAPAAAGVASGAGIGSILAGLGIGGGATAAAAGGLGGLGGASGLGSLLSLGTSFLGGGGGNRNQAAQLTGSAPGLSPRSGPNQAALAASIQQALGGPTLSRSRVPQIGFGALGNDPRFGQLV